MESWRQGLIVAALALLVLRHEAYGQGAPVEGRKPTQEMAEEEVLQSLVSTNRSTRLAAAVELDDQRRRLVQKLMAILDGTNSDKVKVAAVIVLGEYRASEAAPLLAQHWEWDEVTRGGFMNARISQEELEELGFPVTEALKKIGAPAIRALLDRIMNTEDTSTAARCISVCQSIEGPEGDAIAPAGASGKRK